mmetsp:Transcript_24506/g.29476  ORF Transcript_24506/g.29476 Transcript_24506/m.29476 type:complete len:198 (+) Transcript_24506:69-662(+)
MKKVSLVVIAIANAVGTFIAWVSGNQGAIELPRISDEAVSCDSNAVVAGWCNSNINPTLECLFFPQFDEYMCTCHGDASVCPDDCVGGTDPYEKAHYWTQCLGIPVDQPNYVLQENQKAIHCAENAVVASWCDEAVDSKLECAMFPETNEYVCKCQGHAADCPVDCVGGESPYKKDHFLTHCKGIPMDQPNYVLKSE